MEKIGAVCLQRLRVLSDAHRVLRAAASLAPPLWSSMVLRSSEMIS
jgi:hypothetical protein